VSTSLDRLRASRLGHAGPRHPLCPRCRYDLVATIAAHGRRCPECGEAFEMSELVPEAREGDWTLWRGLRRAGLVLPVKGLVCAGVWALMLTAHHLLVPGSGWLRLLRGLLVLATGGAVGAVLAHRIDEHLGFAGLGVAVALIVVSVIVLGLGTVVAVRFGASTGDTMLPLFFACLASAGFIVKKAYLDEQ